MESEFNMERLSVKFKINIDDLTHRRTQACSGNYIMELFSNANSDI